MKHTIQISHGLFFSWNEHIELIPTECHGLIFKPVVYAMSTVSR